MKEISHSIYRELFPQKMLKSEQTKFKILNAAIWCYVHYGIEKTTFENIAARAKVVRPLVMRYFPEKNELLELAIRYIRANLQNLSVEAVEGLTQADEVLEAYVRSTFRWIEEFPQHAKVWLLFYYYCSIKKEFRAMNSELVTMGQKRITAILALGVKQKLFHAQKVGHKAKAIQNLITGSLLAALTETPTELTLTQEQVVKTCFSLANHA